MLGDKVVPAWKYEILHKRLRLGETTNPIEWRQSIESLRNRAVHGKDLGFRPTTATVPTHIRGTSWDDVIDLVEEVDSLVRSAEQIE